MRTTTTTFLAWALLGALLTLPSPAQGGLWRAAAVAVCACTIAGPGCHREKPATPVPVTEEKAANVSKDALVAIAADPGARVTGVVAVDAGRTYVVHEGQLYSWGDGEAPRWERPPRNVMEKIRKIAVNDGTALVLYEDGRLRVGRDGGIGSTIVAENVTDVSAEGSALWVSLAGQRMRYENGQLRSDD